MVFKSVPGIIKRRSFIILFFCLLLIVIPLWSAVVSGLMTGILKVGGAHAIPVAVVVGCILSCWLCLIQTYASARFFGWMPAGNLECTVA